MPDFLLRIPTKTRLLIFGLVFIIIIMTIFVALQTPSEDSLPLEQQITPSETAIIGKKITPDVEKKLDIIKKEASDDGKLVYSLKSENPLRTDQIITQKESIVFQRTYIPENPNDPAHLLISNMLKKNGHPEQTIQGSKLWGPFMNTYIYPAKGIAFIGNPNNDEVYELQNFSPISLDEYLQKYGDDIDQTPPSGES